MSSSKNDRLLLYPLQAFRAYREAFEEQKVVIEQRFRGLLESAIQDAIFLSARNSELTRRNQELEQGGLGQLHSISPCTITIVVPTLLLCARVRACVRVYAAGCV